MFLSSYAFLFLALAIKNYQQKTVFILLVLASFIGVLATFFMTSTRINPDEAKVTNIHTKNEQVAGYLVTYVLPFLGFDFENKSDQLALLVIFIIICILYIRADLIYINPTLLLLGYNIFDVTLDEKYHRTLISSRNLHDIKFENIEFYELHDRLIIIEKTDMEANEYE